MKRRASVSVVSAATALDLVVCTALVAPPEALPATLRSTAPLLLLVVVHTTCALALALALYPLLPSVLRQAGQVRRAGQILLGSLCLLLPVFGPLFVVAGVLGRLIERRRSTRAEWRRVPVPTLPYRPREVAGHPDFRDGALAGTLRHGRDPERRVRAVMAARGVRDATDVAILRLALVDPVDDVRLLAYSILDRREQALSRAIQELRVALAAAPANARAALHRRLAYAQFEPVYLGLARGEIRSFLLTESEANLEALLEASPGDRRGLFLLGRVWLRLGQLEAAAAAFSAARAHGLDPLRTAPYLAEIALRSSSQALAGTPHGADGARAALAAVPAGVLFAHPTLAAVARHLLGDPEPR